MNHYLRFAKAFVLLFAVSLASVWLLPACSSGQEPGKESVRSTGLAVTAPASTASQSASVSGAPVQSPFNVTPGSSGLALTVLTNSCGTNQVQNFFEVTNNGTAPVPLSAIQIKFWPDDTSGQGVVPQVFTGGCVSDAGNPSCVHQVQGVKAAPTSFSACGAPGQQANWEITISNTDGAMLPPGATWSNLQSQVHLANFGNFSPGTADWYSACVVSQSYVNTATFALYDAGQLVRSSTGVPPSCRAPSGTQTIAGNVPPAVATAPLVGTVPGATVLTLSLTLPLQLNGAPGSGFPPLTTFIAEISSPTGPRPAPLTPAQFAAAYGPPASSYSALENFATANGLTIVNTVTAQDLLTVTGTVAAIENAFFVTLNVYQRPDGTTFYAPANAPSVNLTVPLLTILGLDNFSRATHSTGTSTVSCGESPVGTSSAFFGADFKNTYFGGSDGCMASLEGQGQTIALYELDSYLPQDVLLYAQGEGGGIGEPALDVPGLNLNPPQLSNVTQELAPKFTPVAYNAFTFAPNFQLQGSEDPEVIEDIQLVLAMAPQANVIVYEANQQSSAFNYATLLTQIANEDRAQTVASAWGWPTSSAGEQMAVWNALSQFAAQAQSFFVGAGDQGALLQDDPYNSAFHSPQPANVGEPIIDSEYMTVVGGTEVSDINAETTWNDANTARTINGVAQNSVTTGGFCTGTSPNASGGASFASLPIPAWQSNVNVNNAEVNSNPLQARMIPDVSIVADGIVAICENCGSAFTAFCAQGTSAGGPLWAAFAALVNQANGVGSASTTGQAGFLNPTLYHLAAASASNFNDIADNSNNNWFDNGQVTETGSVEIFGLGTAPPIGVPYAETTDSSGITTNSPLPGSAVVGASEALGSYHAVAGYDLATGLGTPTCNLFGALAPNFTPPGGGGSPPPGGVTINYHQVGECEGFPEDTDFPEAGFGLGFVIFGIDSIVNAGTTPFNFTPANLFGGTNGFAFQNSATLDACSSSGAVNCPVVLYPVPFTAPATVNPGTTLTLTGGAPGTQFLLSEIEIAIPPGSAGSVEASFFLNYSQTAGVSPINGGTLAPNVTLVKSNTSAAEIAALPDMGDCSLITPQ